MKKSSPFRFKKFEVSHSRSSMKVGVDGVLIGCWVRASEAGTILDVGTGCGVVALICAQRFPEASIRGIDIDAESVDEANFNFNNSLFSGRLQAEIKDFLEMPETERFDLIISNPPFFSSGVKSVETAREKARHELSLPLSALIVKARRLMTDMGVLALVLPVDRFEDLVEATRLNGLCISRQTTVKGHPDAPAKRILVEITAAKENEDRREESELTMMQEGTTPTDEYRQLTKDFYLNY